MKKIVFILFLFLINVVTTLSMAASIKTIRFATEATYPPFEFIDSSGQIKGFDIDIAKALCKQINANCTFANQSFSSLIPSLNLGKFDTLIAAIGVTTERQKQVSFTFSYYEPSAVFVGQLSKHYSTSDLTGKIIGVQQGTTFEKYLANTYKDKITIKTYASIQDAFLDLSAGRVEIVLSDTPIAQNWLKQNDNSKQFSMIGGPIVNHDYFGMGYGIALRKNDTELVNALNKALTDIKTNGTYAMIVKKYFGV